MNQQIPNQWENFHSKLFEKTHKVALDIRDRWNILIMYLFVALVFFCFIHTTSNGLFLKADRKK